MTMEARSMPVVLDGRTVRSALIRFVGLTGLWIILSAGNTDDPLVALIVILVATAASLRLWPRKEFRLSFYGLIRFVPYFLIQSAVGGWDVSRRALLPSMPINPGFTEYRFSLTSEPAQVFFTWVVSLLPGTAGVRLRGGLLVLHVLDLDRYEAVDLRLKSLEKHIAALFGEYPASSSERPIAASQSK